MKLAAIDIGSNSIHMIVAEIGAPGEGPPYTVLDREKDMVKLAAGCFAGASGGRLTDEAFGAGLHALRKMRKLCERHQVDDIVATATSAVREAANGGDFLAEVERQTGIRVEVITGEEEARLIWLAARSAIDFARGGPGTGTGGGTGAAGAARALILDVGGGSVEAVLGDARRIAFATSFKLGVQRLRDRTGAHDPLGRRGRKALADHIRERAGPALRQARDLGFDTVCGTSGTILAVGALARSRRGGGAGPAGAGDAGPAAPAGLNGIAVALADIQALNQALEDLGLAARAKLRGVDPNRADTIQLGGILVQELCELAGAKEIVLCDRALREGLVLDYIDRNFAHLERRGRVPDLRRRTVLELLARSGGDRRLERHHHHVARLALSLFDQTRRLHDLGLAERALLEFAALVHDVGGQIAFEGHERHSYYLIRNADLRGFTRAEVEVLALVARFHRGPRPRRRRHAELAALSRRDRRVVRRLSAILRIADGLDRSHFQSVRGLKVAVAPDAVRIGVEAAADAELEIFTARRKGRLFERVFGRALEIAQLPHAVPAKFDGVNLDKFEAVRLAD